MIVNKIGFCKEFVQIKFGLCNKEMLLLPQISVKKNIQ